LKKPVVVWNGGITEKGKGAAATHTGSIAGNAVIFLSAMKQAGAITATDRSEFLQLLRLLQPQFKLPYGNLAVISPGGGNTVSICDLIASRPNLKLPRFTDSTREKLLSVLPEENVDINNPVDTGGAGISVLDKILPIIISDSSIESVLVLLDMDFLAIFQNDEKREQFVDSIAGTIIESVRKSGKTVHVLVIQHRQNHEVYDGYRRLFINNFNQNKIPWIAEPFSNVAAIYSKLVWYRNYLKSHNI
jgi:acyl-CoA synthetase (NDP forming)